MLLHFGLNIVIKALIVESKPSTTANFYCLAPYLNIYSKKAANS